jgi:hypothetical protein
MENAVKSRLQSILLGEPQIYKNIAIVPLIAPTDGTFQYRTLGEALSLSDLAITEVSTAGSVPDLLVVNRGRMPVLLVDGEELAGAKQNRVLNTSILLQALSETKIPVSCTEQGRWAYASKAFSESGHVMAYKSRSRKTNSVHSSLEASAGHKSDQGEVWHGIAELQAQACMSSPTSAMSDVYKAREDDLRKCDDIFKPVPNQVGLLAFIGGAPVGADAVSLTGAYAKLHPKLVRSYTLEGLLDQGRAPIPGRAVPTDGRALSPLSATPQTITSEARKFLDDIASAGERPFPSVAHGTDFRYRSSLPPSGFISQPCIVGSALVHENEVIHAAFFRLDRTEQADRMASYRARRRQYYE